MAYLTTITKKGQITIPKEIREILNCEILFEKIKKGELKVFTLNLVLAEIVWVCASFYQIKKIELYEKYNIKFIDALIASNPAIFQKSYCCFL
jgi:AbrB family looped-hinge helix DNA binding protein